MKRTTSFDILLSIAHSHPFNDRKETPTITPFPPPSPFDCSRYACYYEPLVLLHTLACWCRLLIDTWYSRVIILADPHRRQAPRLTLTNYDLHQYHNHDTNLLTVHLPRHLVLTPPNADILTVVVPSSSLLLATDLTATVDIHSLHHPAHVTAAPRFYGDHLVIADDPLLRRGVIQSLHDSITTKHPGKDKKPLTLWRHPMETEAVKHNTECRTHQENKNLPTLPRAPSSFPDPQQNTPRINIIIRDFDTKTSETIGFATTTNQRRSRIRVIILTKENL
ncbi:hypothetical protein H4582DRAFT_2086241 [Lactarius indigo]|nr:hypothetical protein H4582DRAFT_2086241 [Lactarius indigo]